MVNKLTEHNVEDHSLAFIMEYSVSKFPNNSIIAFTEQGKLYFCIVIWQDFQFESLKYGYIPLTLLTEIGEVVTTYKKHDADELWKKLHFQDGYAKVICKCQSFPEAMNEWQHLLKCGEKYLEAI